MRVTPERSELVRAFLDDLYAEYDGVDLSSRDNVVVSYAEPRAQIAYSVMYFAKHVGCWSAIRECLGTPLAPAVYSFGAGPLFCLTGWFFDQAPAPAERVYGLDLLAWEAVRQLDSHATLLADVLGLAVPDLPTGIYFPDRLPPQCAPVAPGGARAVDIGRLIDGATFLFPMVLNHLIGNADSLVNPATLLNWLGRLQERAGRIVIVDMEATKVPYLWQSLEALTGLTGTPVFSFHESSSALSACYGTRVLSSRPESTRRTGIAYPSFCRVTACTFERGRGWRWITA